MIGKNISTTITHFLNENKHLDIDKMYGWYSSFKDKYYKDIQSAYNNIKHVVNHHNKQFGNLFGEENPKTIIGLFNFTETENGIKIVPKIKRNNSTQKDIEYNTNDILIDNQKQLWVDNRGIEIGRYLSDVKYMNTNDSRIYGTEKIDNKNVLNIIDKLKDGDDLPPILLDYDYGILDGHHRWEAAKKLNIKSIPVLIYKYPHLDGV